MSKQKMPYDNHDNALKQRNRDESPLIFWKATTLVNIVWSYSCRIYESVSVFVSVS